MNNYLYNTYDSKVLALRYKLAEGGNEYTPEALWGEVMAWATYWDCSIGAVIERWDAHLDSIGNCELPPYPGDDE